MAPFLFRPKPLQGESLISYIYRVAAENYAAPYDIWKLVMPGTKRRPNSGLSTSLNIYPYNVFNIRKFESMLLLDEGQLDALTFIPVYIKLGIAWDNIFRSQVLDGLIHGYRRYCPECLRENSVHKLIWQVKEVKLCDAHNITLMSACWKCNSQIPMLSADASINYCPHCFADLRNAPRIKSNPDSADLRVFQDWRYLLGPSETKLQPAEGISTGQTTAIKLLFIIRSNRIDVKKRTTQSIWRVARNNIPGLTNINLGLVLSVLRKSGLSFEDLCSIEVPEGYIDSDAVKKVLPITKKLSCIAPWCDGYMKPGTLKRTKTFKRQILSGETFNFYMYCSKCGIKYCIDKSDNQLVERGYFIDLAWRKVRGELHKKLTLIDLAKSLNVSRDQAKRAIIYLAANKLIDNMPLPIELPHSHNPKTVQDIMSLIDSGMTLKDIREKLHLSYNTLLYYLFFPSINVKSQTRGRYSQCELDAHVQNKKDFDHAIKCLTDKGIKLTVKSVSAFLNISPATFTYRGLLPELKQAKSSQQNSR